MTQTLAAKYTDCTLPPKSTLQVQSWHLPLQTKHIHSSLLMIHLSRKTWGKFQETASLNHGNVMSNPNTTMMSILVMNLKSSMIMLLSWLCPDRTWSRSSWLFNLFCSLGWPPSPTLFSDVSVMCVHSRWIFLNQTQFFWSSIPILPSTTARPKGKAARQKSNIFFIWGLLVMYCPTCKIPKIP